MRLIFLEKAEVAQFFIYMHIYLKKMLLQYISFMVSSAPPDLFSSSLDFETCDDQIFPCIPLLINQYILVFGWNFLLSPVTIHRIVN